MNLDNLDLIKELDTEDMLAEIDGLPQQLSNAWAVGLEQPDPPKATVTRVIVAGMGGSAIGADLVAAYISPFCPVPVVVLRDYTLPAWAHGPKTLLVASSHSGNTEETLSVFEQAIEYNCTILAVSTGGQLAKRALETNTIHWTFAHKGQPRAAVGWSFGLLLAAFYRMGLIPDQSSEVKAAVEAMRKQQALIQVGVPAAENPAKRQALQFIDRWVAIFAAEHLAPVARRWKGQISELAKAWGQFETLPEANHNTLAGVVNPESVLTKTYTVFLKAPGYHKRNSIRSRLTKRAFMLEGVPTDVYKAKGESRLAQQWTAIHFGDYTGYYLAIAYHTDPTPVEALVAFKQELSSYA